MEKKNILGNVSNILLAIAILGFIGYQIYKLPKFGGGEVVPSFSATLLDGSIFQLSDLQGKYVLLDFWGSWCGPCRRESPELVRLYDSEKDKVYSDGSTFEIVSIAIETNESSWKKAIQNDHLKWKHHIVQLDRFSGQIARSYGVKEIPTKYLLDKQGKVLLVNPSFEEISTFLKTL